MTVIVKAIAFTVVFTTVFSLERAKEGNDVLNKIIQLLSNQPTLRRDFEKKPIDTSKAENFYKQLAKNLKKKHKQILREEKKEEVVQDDIPQDPDDKQAEKELKESLSQMQSALLDHPHIEQSGKRDYLVMDNDKYDHFVTVVPNAMYQRVESKCVNWLDDCSLKGIRSRLLRGIRSPYR